MDLNDYKPVEEIIVKLKNPKTIKYDEDTGEEAFSECLMNDDGTPMSITFYAPSTREFKKVITSLKVPVDVDNPEEEVDPLEVEDNTLETLYKLATSWNITVGGKKPKLGPKSFKDTLEKFFWIQPQVWDGFNKYEVFTPT